MENNIPIKGTVALSAFTMFLYTSFNEIVVALAFLMIADYLTGVMAAFKTKGVSLQIARDGIIKKVGFFFLVFLAFTLDFVIYFMTNKMGLSISTRGMFGIATCIWLIGTEGLSIADNLSRVGVPIPNFLISAYKRVKKLVEQTQEVEGGNKNE